VILTDENSRHDFHTSSTLLQVICQLLESELAQHFIQLEFVAVEREDDFLCAIRVANSPEFEESEHMQSAFRQSAEKINSRFQRYDGTRTAEVEPGNFGLVTIRVTDSQAFSNLN